MTEISANPIKVIQLQSGTFNIYVYSLVNSLPDETPTPANLRSLGVNMYMEFIPSSNRNAKDIQVGFIQLIEPISLTDEERRREYNGWAVDRGNHRIPYYGFNDFEQPIPFSHATYGARDLKFVKYLAQFGYTRKGKPKVPASLADTPRELVADNLDHRARFVTLAYELENGLFLGGITWGYEQKSNSTHGEAKLLEIGEYELSHGIPKHEQLGAIRAWNSIQGNEAIQLNPTSNKNP